MIPRGTTYRFRFDEPQRWLTFYTPGEIETPNRYRNRYGQLLEHAPFSQRDFHPPTELVTHRDRGEHQVKVRVRGGYQDYVLDYHPLDVVGWDGYVYPYTFNIADFEPKAGRLHQPPPAHQTFQGPNFVICSFCPRMLDWDPMAVALPYHHSNVQSEEVMYYVDGDYAARKGVDIGSFTLHPCGLPHGPQPGTVEKSLGIKETYELAVMCDTFRPLKLTTLVARPRRPELRVLLVRGPGAVRSFRWVDGERTIVFGRGALADAVETLGGPGYTLLTTARAKDAAPGVVAARGRGAHRAGAGTSTSSPRTCWRVSGDRWSRWAAGGWSTSRRRSVAANGGARDGGPDDVVGRGDDPHPPARGRRGRVHPAGAARGRHRRPRAGRVPAAARSSPRAR